MRIAAIDQGTTSTRLLVATADGEAGIVASARHRQTHPQSGWAEQDPLELLRNITTCLGAAGQVDAIGIANQGESCLAWDAVSGDPLSPVIGWQDSRTRDAIERLRAAGAEEETVARAGLPLDPYFSASKLAWIVANVPAARHAHAAGRLRLGTTDAFFLERLAGRFVTDATTASRTSLMNLETGDWDKELCRLFGVPLESLPPIGYTAGTEIGAIANVPITASVVDQQAALHGHGCHGRGDAKITFGTGAFALANTGSSIVRAPEVGLLSTIAWKTPDETVYAVEGGVYDAGAAIEWLLRIGILSELGALEQFTNGPAIDRGLVFVPALSGLACPHWDRSAAGMWIGMAADTSRHDLAQAALEGIALCVGDVLDAMAQRVPLDPRLSIDGGLSRSASFARFLADTTGYAVHVRSFDELTSLGCASLSALALGVVLSTPFEDSVIHDPAPVDRAWRRQRFADAVARSRSWR
jgi:glycerol kinase